MVEEQTAASHSLAKEAASLNQLLAQFKLGHDENHPPSQTSRQPVSSIKPVASPARALGTRVASAFGGGNVAAATDTWEEF
jgi:methyl-accepting chemotaxis protein